MNSKIAKKLRRLAERNTVGAPVAAYERNEAGTRRVDPRRCTRGLYRALKRQAAAAGR